MMTTNKNIFMKCSPASYTCIYDLLGDDVAGIIFSFFLGKKTGEFDMIKQFAANSELSEPNMYLINKRIPDADHYFNICLSQNIRLIGLYERNGYSYPEEKYRAGIIRNNSSLIYSYMSDQYGKIFRVLLDKNDSICKDSLTKKIMKINNNIILFNLSGGRGPMDFSKSQHSVNICLKKVWNTQQIKNLSEYIKERQLSY